MAATIDIDDHGLADRLALFSRKQIRTAERRGVTEAAKFGRSMARGLAPKATGAGARGISYKTRSRGTGVSARIFNKVYYMRFQARGVPTTRYTQNGSGRGTLPAKRFMQDTADVLDGGTAKQLISQSVGEALRAAGL